MLRVLKLLWVTGARLRCPNCAKGELFRNWFTLHPTCSVCGVRFERYEGEATGGMTISIVVMALLFLIGYIMGELLTDWPVSTHLAIWLPFAVIFPVWFYRYSRALWVVMLYLGGAIFVDEEPYEESTLTLTDAFLLQPDKNSSD